jgi:hypothetical protein
MVSTPYHLMTESITVERGTNAVDAGRSPTVAWPTHLSSIPARVTRKGGSDQFTGGGVRQRAQYTIIVAAGLDILGTDRIKWTKDGVVNTIKITGPPRDGSGMGAIMIIDGEQSEA